MDLSSGQQRLVFAVVVAALAGLGIYLIGPARSHGATAASTTPPASAPPGAASAPAVDTSAPPAMVPTTTAGDTSPGGADIYQWLPFSQQDLTEAAQTTVAFAADYQTYSYTETASAYSGKMTGLVTAELAATLQNAYMTPGVAAPRLAQKEVSRSSGAIASIRSFSSGAIVFIVNIAQQLTTTTGTSTQPGQYAVTVVSAAGGWQVSDIELATAGNR